MHESTKEKLSLFVDDELSTQHALAILKAANEDPDIAKTLARYQLIGQAIKSETIVPLRADFLSRIQQQLEHEPIYLLPLPPRRSKPKLMMAIAASIVLFTVLWLSKQPPGSMLDAQRSAMTLAQTVTKTQPSPAFRTKTNQPPIQADYFDDYLLAHNNSLYTNSQAHLQAYAQVTGYKQ